MSHCLLNNGLSSERQQTLEQILKKYPKGSEKAAAREILYHFLSPSMSNQKVKEILKSVSYSCGVSLRTLAEVLRNDLSYEKGGDKAIYNIEVCTSLPCVLRGAGEILKTCEKWLGLPCGSQTVDRRFSLNQINCLNQCTRGPVVKVNHHQKEELTPTQVVFWLQTLLEEKSSSSPSFTVVRNPYTPLRDLE